MDRYILTGVVAALALFMSTCYIAAQMIPQWALEEAVDTTYWHTTVEYE